MFIMFAELIYKVKNIHVRVHRRLKKKSIKKNKKKVYFLGSIKMKANQHTIFDQ